MQESEYTTDGRDSHASPGGTSRSDISPHQMTGKQAHKCATCNAAVWLCVLPDRTQTDDMALLPSMHEVGAAASRLA